MATQIPEQGMVTVPIPIARNGINKDIEPTSLEGVFTPWMKNMLLEPNMIKKRLGYSQLGSNLPLTGTGMKLHQYVDARGNVHLLAMTTTHAYEYDTTAGTWILITPSKVLDACESGWTAGTNVTNADSTTHVQGTYSQSFTLTAARADGDKLGYTDFTAVDVSAKTYVGFWIRASAALAASALEVVVCEAANGAKTGTYVESLSTALAADTWTFVCLAKTLTSCNAVISIGLYANATLANGLVIYLDDVRGFKPFGTSASKRWSCDTVTDLNYFTGNGGSALVLTNQVDDLYYYEGDSGDVFATLVHGYTSFATCDVVAEFWNHLLLGNFTTSARASRSIACADIGDIDDWTTGTSNLFYLTDSIGQIRDIVKLGADAVIYSDYSVTICRYRGGDIVFVFPTLIYHTGIFSPKAAWGTETVHYFLGSDLRVHKYANGAHLFNIGRPIEASLFAEADVSKKAQMLSGYDAGRDRLYFAFPKASQDYSKNAYVLNRRYENEPWEYYEFADSMCSFALFENPASAWYCDDAAWTDIYCDEIDMYCDDSYGQAGYPMTVFLSDDGYVFKLDAYSGMDDASNIECEYQTQDLTIDKEEHFGRWEKFGFTARSDIISGTVSVFYSGDGSEAWTEFDESPVTLTNAWHTSRLAMDATSRKMRFRFLQNSACDLKIRDDMHALVKLRTAREID